MFSVENALKRPAGLSLTGIWGAGGGSALTSSPICGEETSFCCPVPTVLLRGRLPVILELALFRGWGRRGPATAPLFAPSKSSDLDPYKRGRPVTFSSILRPETTLQADSALLLPTLDTLADRFENCPLILALLNLRMTELAELRIMFSPR